MALIAMIKDKQLTSHMGLKGHMAIQLGDVSL